MMIDTHCHVVPPNLPPPPTEAATAQLWPRLDYSSSATPYLVSGRSRLVVRDVFWQTEARLAAMEASGVDAEVLSPMPFFLGTSFAPEDGLRLARHVNEFVAALCRGNPDRFYGLGSVPLQDPELATRELSEVHRLGLRGVEILAHVNGASLGERRFLSFFQEAERLGLGVFIHGMTPVAPERLGPGASATFGVTEDITVAAIALLSEGVLERCPNLRIALSHGGGGFPLMLPRAHFFWSGAWNEGPPSASAMGGGYTLPRSPTEYARRFYYDTLVFDGRAIRYLRDLLGADRLLVGTDHPAMIRETPVGATLRSIGLPAGEVAAIGGTNALAFLGVACVHA